MQMKKLLVIFVLITAFSVSAAAYSVSPKDIYGEPDKGYEQGYADGLEAAGEAKKRKTQKSSTEGSETDSDFYVAFLGGFGAGAVTVLILSKACKKAENKF